MTTFPGKPRADGAPLLQRADQEPRRSPRREDVPAGSVPSPVEVAGSTVLRVMSMLETLAPAERRVGMQVIEDPELVVNSTARELARRCGVSESTMLRFCRALGFSSHAELRVALAGRLRPGPVEESWMLDPEDSLPDLLDKIGAAGSRAVADTVAGIDPDLLDEVADRIDAAGRVEVYGVGASAVVALDLEQKLFRIGRAVRAHHDLHSALTGAALLGAEDVAIGVSHTGLTGDTVAVLREARAHGATTVALTNAASSPITEGADYTLLTRARETPLRMAATASRLAQLALVDCLFTAVARRSYASSRQAVVATFDAVSGHRLRRGRTARTAEEREAAQAPS